MSRFVSAPPRGRLRARAAALVCLALLSAGPVAAAQIVSLDLKPANSAAKGLARSLNPILVSELSKVDGMSVVSADDVRALLEHEANKAALGCDDTSCMTDIAGSLGAELLVSSTVSTVGRDAVVALTLLQVDGAKVVARGTGQAPRTHAPEAVAAAVHELFKEGLPRELSGPASMSRRGFKAALQGLLKVVLTQGQHDEAQASRRRVVLDLVNTELDYDAQPKIVMFKNALQRGARAAKLQHIGAKNSDTAAHYDWAQNMINAMRHDAGRVEEIRERARARGLVPSARPLRFEDPEPPTDMPDADDFARYWRNATAARKVVVSWARAYNRGDVDGALKWMAADRQSDSNRRSLDSAVARDAKRKVKLEMVPRHAYTVELRQRAAESLKKEDETVVYLLRWVDGAPHSEERITLVKEKDGWRVKYY